MTDEMRTTDEKPLVIEDGKRYVLRNGRITGRLTVTGTGKHQVWSDDDGHVWVFWSEGGTYMRDGTESPWDIIAEYVEAPPAPQSDVLREEVTALSKKMLAIVEENARMRGALTKCDELFSKIDNDWSDPRSDCCEGSDIIAAALSQQANKEQNNAG